MLAEELAALQEQLDAANAAKDGAVAERDAAVTKCADVESERDIANTGRDCALNDLEQLRAELASKLEEETLRSQSVEVEKEQINTLQSSIDDYKNRLQDMTKLSDQLEAVNGKIIFIIF